MSILAKKNTGLAFVTAFVSWMLIDLFLTYFAFQGNAPILFVGLKDILLGLFVVTGFGIWLISLDASSLALAKPWWNWFTLLCILALGYFILDILRAHDIAASMHGLLNFLAPLTLLLAGYTIGSRPGFNAKLFVGFIATALTPVMLFGLYQYFFFTPHDLITLGYISDKTGRTGSAFLRNNHAGISLGGIRAFGVFDSPLVFGMVAILTFYNSYIGWRWSVGLKKLLHIFAGMLSIAALIASYTRSEVLAFLVSLFFLPSNSKTMRMAMTILLLLIAIPLGLSRTFGRSGLDPSTVGHLEAYARTYKYLIQQPYGYGVSFAGTRPGQVPVDGDYLNALLDLGPVGLIVFLWSYISIYRFAGKARRRSGQDAPESMVRAVLLAFMITMLAVMIYKDGGSWIMHLWIGVLLGYGGSTGAWHPCAEQNQKSNPLTLTNQIAHMYDS